MSSKVFFLFLTVICWHEGNTVSIEKITTSRSATEISISPALYTHFVRCILTEDECREAFENGDSKYYEHCYQVNTIDGNQTRSCGDACPHNSKPSIECKDKCPGFNSTGIYCKDLSTSVSPSGLSGTSFQPTSTDQTSSILTDQPTTSSAKEALIKLPVWARVTIAVIGMTAIILLAVVLIICKKRRCKALPHYHLAPTSAETRQRKTEV
ncbi:uncharacterized protein [Watersipora subatra]|uniref:uncharacterized protein n=1 Tax=Watersipora subatra TaxID=2589382 RepID=UPI00355B75C2